MDTQDNYILERTSDEYRRLRTQGKMFEPATTRLLQRVGLRDGFSCLDVGCGTGDVMGLMGQMVAPTGQVTGIDVDGKIGREALQVLQATGKGRFSFVEQNLEGSDSVSGQPFDLTFARLVLLHLRDPVAALRKMHAWTKVGGYLAVQDCDFRTLDVYPRLGAMAEFVRVVQGVFQHAGRDLQFGHKLPAYFEDAGIGAPDGIDVICISGSLSQLGPMFQAVYRSLLPQALRFGVTDEPQSQRFLDEMAKATGGQYRSAFGPLLVSVWKQKAV